MDRTLASPLDLKDLCGCPLNPNDLLCFQQTSFTSDWKWHKSFGFEGLPSDLKTAPDLLTFSPKPWHGIMDHFPREVSTLFPSHVQQIRLWNIYSIYKYKRTYKPSTCRPPHTICPRSSTLIYNHTLFFWTINNNGSCSLQHIHSKYHDICIWLGLMHHSLNWYVWRIRVSTSLCLKVNQLEVYILADRRSLPPV